MNYKMMLPKTVIIENEVSLVCRNKACYPLTGARIGKTYLAAFDSMK